MNMMNSSIKRPADESRERGLEQLRRSCTPFIQYLTEEGVVEIMLNPDGKLFVEKLGEGIKHVGFVTPVQAIALMTTIAGLINEIVDRQNPILECEFPLDNSRFEGLIPPVVQNPTFALRLKASKIFTLAEYVEKGIMTPEQEAVIKQAILDHKNILICGGTGSGKTTLTNAVIHQISETHPTDRLVIIEDTGELQCSADNYVTLRATIDVSMLTLLKATMRLRPDRILVGEVRGGEALSLLKAWNTGHPGGVATVHANGPEAGLIRMASLIQEATPAPMDRLIAEAVNIVVFIQKTQNGRKVSAVVEVMDYVDGKYVLKNL